MAICKGCGEDTVRRDEMPRYDVLNPDFDAETDDMNDFGPYDADCFAATATGQHVTP